MAHALLSAKQQPQVIDTVSVYLSRPVNLILQAAFWVLASLLLTGCQDDTPSRLERIKQSGELKVVTRNTPTTYYEGSDGPTGIEYELAALFAKHLNVSLNITTTDSIQDLYTTLVAQNADIAAAGLEISLDKLDDFYYGPAYMEVDPVVIYNRRQARPGTPEDLLGGQLAVIADSQSALRMRELQQKYPTLSWKETSDLEATDLIRMVNDGELDYALVNSHELEINSAYYSQVKAAFAVTPRHKLAWAIAKGQDNSLYFAMRDFFLQLQQEGTLAQMHDRYYGHTEELDYVGVQIFLRHVRDRLPQYEHHFKGAAKKYNLDWKLLAAVGYQESHWRPEARSPTGVRGIMMLTLNTAGDLGVTNRLDPKQSIYGGARYLAKLIRRIPERIQEPDRTWFALAAYNVGFGHLEDARIITEHLKYDPDKWIDVRQHLPLLQKKSWYRHTKHGFARGQEPVTYVQNIRQYYDILHWYDSRLQQLSQQTREETPMEAVNFSIIPPIL